MKNTDKVGIISSVLCLIHCLALPIIAMLGAWGNNHFHEFLFLDWIFAALSSFAAYYSIKKTNLISLKISFILGWVFFIIGILGHGSELEYFMHAGTVILIISHWKNLKSNNGVACKKSYK